MNVAIVSEVYNEMRVLRLRETVRTDSSRLACAIKCIAVRRRVSYAEIEAQLDQALCYRARRK